ncbi:MAG TPA: serine/threonine-protein kinase [Polyangiaceae bacterium]|nr:serine/threonine-protein kinase [Polyangiaceae bacterium]
MRSNPPPEVTVLTKFLSGTSEAERHLDRFELIAELASGGMATVFLARLSGVGGFQRFVAIKRLHPHLANDQEFVQMFLDEARLAARLHHPNVVPILEIGTSKDGYYLVMEYVEGDTLARILARSAQAGRILPPQVSTRVCLDAIAGLHAAHEMKDDDSQPLNIVHRDVSPQNILIGMDGSGRITDFGVARATTRLSTTRTGQLKGKLAYMAPEQARGSAVDRRADIFAMGIVVWECLAQKRLFKGEGEADTLNRVLYEPIPALRQSNPQVAAPLEEAVMKALERDPAQRYATAAEFGDALEKAAREVGVLGSHKDVAAHLESVLGTDISAQRDAVRSWLARSEPSQRYNPMGAPSGIMQSVTRVEGVPGAGVSSVSSAVIPMAGSSPSSAPMPPSSYASLPQPRKRMWLWIAAPAAVVLLGVGGFALKHAATPPPAATTVAPPPITAVSQTTPPAAVAPPVASPAVAEVASSAPTAAPTHTSHAGWKPPPGTGVHSGTKPPPTSTQTGATPPPTATAAPTVDDISKNPYR